MRTYPGRSGVGEGEPDGARRGRRAEKGSRASRPPGPAPSSSRGWLPGPRRGASVLVRVPDARVRREDRPSGPRSGTWWLHPGGGPGSAAGAMRTEFGAQEAERGRPLHLLPGALCLLPAALASSRRPRGE